MKRKVAFGLAAVFAAIVVMGCGGAPSAHDEAIARYTPVRTEPAKKQAWVITPTKARDTLYFTGVSRAESTVSDAQAAARRNGAQQLVDYYGTFMKDAAVELVSRFGLANETFSPQVAEQDLHKRVSEALAQALMPEDYYTEYYIDETNRQSIVAYALMGVEKARAKKVLEDFGKEQAAQLQQKAAQEQDAARRQQTQKAAEALNGYINGWFD
ncbi:hypothetical protein FACS1894137_11700 [Spirochaetia bacterium]|nr:hypothetical protein FACS1894137_11700 [Spirochaetia bacterium]